MLTSIPGKVFLFSFQLVSDDDQLSRLIKERLEESNNPTKAQNLVVRFAIYFFGFSFVKRRQEKKQLETKIKAEDTDRDSVISILLHFIMPLSIISTDYMQLDLLYSFLLSAWTDTRRFRLQIHRYMCVCFYTAWRKGQWLALHGYPGVEGQRPGPPPSPCPRLFLGSHFSKKKKEEQNKENRR